MQLFAKKIIRGGFVVADNEELLADIYISGERISHILPADTEIPTDFSDAEVLDATGLVVLPGGVDAHTHFDLDIGIARSSDDFFTGTVAAACGGTTTIIDHMAFGNKGTLPSKQLATYHELAKDKAVIDYSFHGVVQNASAEVLSDLENLKKEGITSIKGYMTYDYRLTEEDLTILLRKTKELGMIFCVHAENHLTLTQLREQFIKEGKTSPIYHPKSRPSTCEADAVKCVCDIAKQVGDAPLYIVHLSSARGTFELKKALAAGQKNLMGETCPQYLFLDDSLYEKEDALKYVMSPPLRTPDDSSFLWEALKKHEIETIGTDHCSFFYSEKQKLSCGDFTKSPNGAPGVESRMMLLFTEAQNGSISLRQAVNWCSTNPAKIFGLYPKKGTIKEGSDADIVLFDPSKHTNLQKEMLHENCDYTPYENIPLKGIPVLTLSRGEIVSKDGTSLAQKGRGKFLKRAEYSASKHV